jgi:hypothetical protein
VGKKHRHPGAILALDKHLPGLVPVGIEWDLGCLEDLARPGRDITVENRGGIEVGGERVEHARGVPLPRRAGDTAQARQLDLPEDAAVEPVTKQLGMRIPEITRDDGLPEQRGALQHRRALGHHLTPCPERGSDAFTATMRHRGAS